jgi:hypothetical protein
MFSGGHSIGFRTGYGAEQLIFLRDGKTALLQRTQQDSLAGGNVETGREFLGARPEFPHFLIPKDTPLARFGFDASVESDLEGGQLVRQGRGVPTRRKKKRGTCYREGPSRHGLSPKR